MGFEFGLIIFLFSLAVFLPARTGGTRKGEYFFKGASGPSGCVVVPCFGKIIDSRILACEAVLVRDAKAYEKAWMPVFGEAQVFGDAQIFGNARVYKEAWLPGQVGVYEGAKEKYHRQE